MKIDSFSHWRRKCISVWPSWWSNNNFVYFVCFLQCSKYWSFEWFIISLVLLCCYEPVLMGAWLVSFTIGWLRGLFCGESKLEAAASMAISTFNEGASAMLSVMELWLQSTVVMVNSMRETVIHRISKAEAVTTASYILLLLLLILFVVF